MITNAKISERLQVSDAAAWVPVANYRQIMAVGVMVAADATEGVTIQLRKAVDASGTSPANHGSAVTALSTGANTTVYASTDVEANALGKTGGGVPYTHVSLTVSKAGSPAPAEVIYGFILRGDGRFNP